MIKTVIFDIGKVMMTWQWDARMIELFGEEAGRAVTRAIMGKNWNELDRGTRTFDEVIDVAVQAEPDYETQIRAAADHVAECAGRCDYAIPWVEELHRLGYRVLYLSNYSSFLIALRPDVLDFVPYMDGGVFSCNVKLTKPEREIYAKLCDRFEMAPEEGLFIDDTAVNIEAARDFGLNAYLFTTYEKSYPEIMALLAHDRG